MWTVLLDYLQSSYIPSISLYQPDPAISRHDPMSSHQKRTRRAGRVGLVQPWVGQFSLYKCNEIKNS